MESLTLDLVLEKLKLFKNYSISQGRVITTGHQSIHGEIILIYSNNTVIGIEIDNNCFNLVYKGLTYTNRNTQDIQLITQTIINRIKECNALKSISYLNEFKELK